MSRHLHLDPFSGIAGDMFLGLLVELGLEPEFLASLPARLGLESVDLHSERVRRGALTATKVHVRIRGWEEGPGGASEDHHATHGKHRHLAEMLAFVERAGLDRRAATWARSAIEALFTAESRVHGLALDEVHLHEAGADDALIDIIGSAAGLSELDVETVSCALPLPVGGGTIRCAHGVLPVPAPAVLALLEGIETIGGPVERELITPTGAALLRALASTFGPAPRMTLLTAGHGAGSSNDAALANVLRGTLGRRGAGALTRDISLLSTTIDDMLAQDYPPLITRLLSAGALDAWTTPVQMKKGRQGTLLSVLTTPEREEPLARTVLEQSSSLGVRIRRERRLELLREFVEVPTRWGAVRVKQVRDEAGRILRGFPEFEDCAALAQEHGIPIDAVRDEARARYLETREER